MLNIFRNSFWQLIVIYVLTAALVTIKIVPRYALHFEIFAVIVALFGALTIKEQKIIPARTGWIVWLAAGLIILFHIIPYLHYNIPIGYDAAFYTAAIDQYTANAVEPWFAGWSPPGLFMLTTIFTRFGVQTELLLTAGVILLEILLGFMIYVTATAFFNRQAGAIAILLYSVSLAQYVTFELNYVKNILAMSLLLAAILFLHRKKYLLAVFIGALVAGVQQPTFLLYGLCYLAYTAAKIKDKEFPALIKAGAVTLLAGIMFYLQAIGPLFLSATSNLVNSTPGSFMNFTEYMFSTLPYLSFAFLGFLIALKNRKFTLLFFWFVINFIVVFLKLFFYNRFVIFLDIIFILYAGYAFSTILAVKRKLAIALIFVVVLSMAITTGREALRAHPNISTEEYYFMKKIPQITEANSTLLSNMVDDAHWLEALSERPVAAPGLFNAGKWTRNEWNMYWRAENFTDIQELMDRLPRPLYIYFGEKSPRGQKKKFETCTEQITQDGTMELLRYTC